MPPPPNQTGGSGKVRRTARIASLGRPEHRPDPPQIKPSEKASQTALPRRIDAILGKPDFIKLAHHLANGSLGKGNFIGSMGEPVYKDIKRKSLAEVIESTWHTIANYDPLAAKPFSLAVYDRNEDSQESNWGAIDLDWHDREQPGPPQQHTMRKLWDAAVSFHEEGKCDALILEISGRGCHLWLVSKDRRHISEWWRLLRSVVARADCAEVPHLELMPCGPKDSGKGHALRLPGSVNVHRFNPRDGAPISSIKAEVGLVELCARLPEPASNNKSVYYGSGTERNPRERAKAAAEERDWLAIHRIEQPASRHNAARSLIVKAACYRPPKDTLRLCEQLYREASPTPTTPLDEHLKDCQQMLDGWIVKLCTLFTPAERAAYDGRVDDRGRQAFHCLHNFHRLALVQGKPDFAVSSEALGRAIGYSYKTALAVLVAFVTEGILYLTSPAIKRCRCARYAWGLDHLSAEETKRRWPALSGRASNIK